MEKKVTCTTCNGSGRERNFDWIYGDNATWKKYKGGTQTCTDCGGSGGFVHNVIHPSDFNNPNSFTQAEFSKENSDKLGEAFKKMRGQ